MARCRPTYYAQLTRPPSPNRDEGSCGGRRSRGGRCHRRRTELLLVVGVIEGGGGGDGGGRGDGCGGGGRGQRRRWQSMSPSRAKSLTSWRTTPIIDTILADPDVVTEDRTITESIADEREVTANRLLLANTRREMEEMLPDLGDTDDGDDDHHLMWMPADTHEHEASGSGVINISCNEE